MTTPEARLGGTGARSVDLNGLRVHGASDLDNVQARNIKIEGNDTPIAGGNGSGTFDLTGNPAAEGVSRIVIFFDFSAGNLPDTDGRLIIWPSALIKDTTTVVGVVSPKGTDGVQVVIASQMNGEVRAEVQNNSGAAFATDTFVTLKMIQ